MTVLELGAAISMLAPQANLCVYPWGFCNICCNTP